LHFERQVRNAVAQAFQASALASGACWTAAGHPWVLDGPFGGLPAKAKPALERSATAASIVSNHERMRHLQWVWLLDARSRRLIHWVVTGASST
jgi:hypothetical protein